jgi:hypothetical protein
LALIDLEHVRNRVLAELPSQLRWEVRGQTWDLDFRRVHHPLQPLSEAEITGPVEEEWKSLYLFCESNFCEFGGAAPLMGVNISSGEVEMLDVEDSHQCFLNSDIESYIGTVKLIDSAVRVGMSSKELIEIASRQIERFDQSEWSLLIQFLFGD